MYRTVNVSLPGNRVQALSRARGRGGVAFGVEKAPCRRLNLLMIDIIPFRTAVPFWGQTT